MVIATALWESLCICGVYCILSGGATGESQAEDEERPQGTFEKDEDLREMAKEEIAEIEPTLPEWEEKIKLLLIPADPQDSKNAILEIRAGTGGDEASLFAGDLLNMYLF